MSESKFSLVIDAVYATAIEPSRWPQTLQAVADYFDDVGANLVYGRDDGSLGTIVSPALEIAQNDYAAGWWQQDIRFSRLVERGYLITSDAFTDRHVATDQEVESHPFYVGFLKRHGLKWVMATSISPDTTLSAILAVQRLATKPAYNDEELTRFRRIGRHVENALRLGIRLISAELTNVALGDALSRLRIGVIALDSLGRVVFINPAGARLAGDGFDIVDKRLRMRPSSAKAEVEAAIEHAVHGELQSTLPDPRPLLVERSRATRPLIFYVLPIGARSTHAHRFLTQARAIVLAIDLQPGEPPDPSVVRDVLGLTLGEARVAALVGSGVPPRGAAEQLGITEETARTTLKRIFAKVGVSRQSELAALLTRLTLG